MRHQRRRYDVILTYVSTEMHILAQSFTNVMNVVSLVGIESADMWT